MSRLNWEKQNKFDRYRKPIPGHWIKVEADKLFWADWRTDKARMKADGYRVRRGEKGWEVWIVQV